MLAYAGQGLPGEGSKRDGLIRDFLGRAAPRSTGLEDAYATTVQERA